MAFSHSPKIATDGLVFYYDTGNGKSYKGEPTTNLIPNIGTSTANWTEHGWSGDFVVSSDFENTFELTATNGWHNATYDFGVSSGGTIYVRFEYKLKSHETNQYNMFVLNGTSLGSYTSYIGTGTQSFEWQTFEGSFTANADTKFAIGLRGQDSSGLTDVMYIRNLQVEQKDHATQFVNGSRSATEGLLDLTKGSTLDISGLSFNSSAEFSFDGTDDRLLLNHPDISSSAGSIEAVIMRLSDTANAFVAARVTGSTNRYYLRQVGPAGLDAVRGNPLTSAAFDATELNTYYHVVMAWDSNTVYAYTNGVLSNQATYTNPGTDLDYLDIGTGPGEYLDMELPVFKLYSKTLTADEVAQNYNAIKNRFGI